VLENVRTTGILKFAAVETVDGVYVMFLLENKAVPVLEKFNIKSPEVVIESPLLPVRYKLRPVDLWLKLLPPEEVLLSPKLPSGISRNRESPSLKLNPYFSDADVDVDDQKNLGVLEVNEGRDE
jgi:hypothetical protein